MTLKNATKRKVDQRIIWQKQRKTKACERKVGPEMIIICIREKQKGQG